MPLTLDLNPAQEHDLETLAQSEGVPSRELAQQIFATALRQKKTLSQSRDNATDFTTRSMSEEGTYAQGEQLTKQAHAETPETPEQTQQRVFALMAKWQAKNPLPVPPGGFKTLAELSAEWAAEAANMTEEERAAEDAFWEERERDYGKRPGISI